MARTRRYKNFERNFVTRIYEGVGGFFSIIGRGLARLFHIFDEKITVMLVPHSNGRAFSIQTNVFAMILGFIMLAGITGSFVYFNIRAIGSELENRRLRAENRETLASLDELRDENDNLLKSARRFQASLSTTLSLLGISDGGANMEGVTGNGDLSSLFSRQDLAAGSLQETQDVKQLTAYLDSAVQPVEEIGKMLENQSSLFTDIPNVWPVKNGIGHISMAFGQQVHPITKQWYIHKGTDFSTWRSGDPVVATANGQIVSVGNDNTFGLSIIIKHKYGIYTRYAHLNTIRVRKGDDVTQGQVIGTIGNTGITTGPHLHYEVHIGSSVVDPAKYINIK
ncbi:MAG: peptidoglycan DD-metalloendopeptidase family protein [Treponema sp.]|nr:peptidoglycan DD-metalloendopeptidase family protein [Treponema sp.]